MGGGGTRLSSMHTGRGSARRSRTVHPTPYTLQPTPHTLHPTPHTLHPTPHTLHPTPYTLHPTLQTLKVPRKTPRGKGRDRVQNPPENKKRWGGGPGSKSLGQCEEAGDVTPHQKMRTGGGADLVANPQDSAKRLPAAASRLGSRRNVSDISLQSRSPVVSLEDDLHHDS